MTGHPSGAPDRPDPGQDCGFLPTATGAELGGSSRLPRRLPSAVRPPPWSSPSWGSARSRATRLPTPSRKPG
ncbi:hypothetical protein I546_6363 [Mycobacterium kansasii 732]|nr:hypothetical protein I546_6363 [Mycobacterium kansasii 732]